MPLPKSLTTVTPFSKALAMALFILLPILAFCLGIKYQEMIANIQIRQLEEKLIQLSRYPTPTPNDNYTNNPSPTCIPRPACLDATPRCLMPESENMCPPKPTGQTACTQEAKLCPDGSYVSRTGPNCEFAKCSQ